MGSWKGQRAGCAPEHGPMRWRVGEDGFAGCRREVCGVPDAWRGVDDGAGGVREVE